MSFWEVHGIFFGCLLLFFLAFLPRLTLFFMGVITGGIGITFWGVVGWIFTPRLLAAIIATSVYWKTNKILCVLTWIIVASGELTEKSVVIKNT